MKVFFDGEYLDDFDQNNTASNFNLRLPSDIYFWQHQKVNDEVRGYIVQRNGDDDGDGDGDNNSEMEFISCFSFESDFSSLSKMKNTKMVKVALILESPHKDEYSTNYTPIRPANGLTGNRIEEHIVTKIQKIIDLNFDYIYQIYIMNPIQYQASCYHELQRFGNSNAQLNLRGKDGAKECRDEVWKILFKRLKDDFISRLKIYAPDIILNCCTGGLEYYIKTHVKTQDAYILSIKKIYDITNKANRLCFPTASGLNMMVDKQLRSFGNKSILTTGKKRERVSSKTITCNTLTIKKKTIQYFYDDHPSFWK